MPKREKTSGSFKPGNKFGALPKHTRSELYRQIKLNTVDDISRGWDYVREMSLDELQNVLKKNSTERGLVLEMASARFHAVKHGDFSKLERIFDRVLGKVKENIEIKTDQKIEIIPPMTDVEMDAAQKKYLKQHDTKQLKQHDPKQLKQHDTKSKKKNKP